VTGGRFLRNGAGGGLEASDVTATIPRVRSSRRSQENDSLVRAAGGLLWRLDVVEPRLAIIHRPKHRDWSLPKGKLRPGESFAAAAVREVAEETGCLARPHEFAGYVLYEWRGRPKLVLFWNMVARRVSPFEPNGEVDRLEWLTPEDALSWLDHPVERQLVRGALAARAAADAATAAR
jgi:8-oxo-dGTP pyrophosphatase MutT (NUDIX family)